MQQLKRIPAELEFEELETKLKKVNKIKGKPTAEQLKSVGVKQIENEENMNKKETLKTITITILVAIIVLMPIGAFMGWKLHELVNTEAKSQAKEIVSLKD